MAGEEVTAHKIVMKNKEGEILLPYTGEESGPPENMVTTDTVQTITASKNFLNGLTCEYMGVRFKYSNSELTYSNSSVQLNLADANSFKVNNKTQIRSIEMDPETGNVYDHSFLQDPIPFLKTTNVAPGNGIDVEDVLDESGKIVGIKISAANNGETPDLTERVEALESQVGDISALLDEINGDA